MVTEETSQAEPNKSPENSESENQLPLSLDQSDEKLKNEPLSNANIIAIIAAIIAFCALGLGVVNYNETKSQFKLISHPQLQIINMGFVDPTFKERPVTVGFQIQNAGTVAAEVTAGKMGWAFEDFIDSMPWERFRNKMIYKLQPFYVSKDRPFSTGIILQDSGDDVVFRLQNYANAFYVFGELYYYDQVYEQHKKYEFVIQILKHGGFNIIDSKTSIVDK